MNPLWQGTFNWKGQVFTDWVRAGTETSAYRLLTIRIANRVQRTPYDVRAYFNGSKDNYEILHIVEKGGEDEESNTGHGLA